MSGKRRDLTSDEQSLWRRVAANVKSRRPAKEVAETETPERVRREAGPRHAPEVVLPRPAKPTAKLAAPADRGAEKRVRRGKLEIGATLDLHGHTQDSAPRALARFLSAAQARGEGVVVIVTGAGRGGQGVLKRMLPEWLAQGQIRPLISGFAAAHRAHGGAGAYYVFLKRSRD